MSIVIKCDISIIEPNLYYIVDIDAHIVLSKGYASYEDADDEAVRRWGSSWYTDGSTESIITGSQIDSAFEV